MNDRKLKWWGLLMSLPVLAICWFAIVCAMLGVVEAERACYDIQRIIEDWQEILRNSGGDS